MCLCALDLGESRCCNINMEEFPYLDSQESIQSYLRSVAEENGVELDDSKLAAALDNKDKLASFRTRFYVPTIGEISEEKKLAEGM